MSFQDDFLAMMLAHGFNPAASRLTIKIHSIALIYRRKMTGQGITILTVMAMAFWELENERAMEIPR